MVLCAVALAWIDLRRMVLPDALVLLLAVLGIAFHPLTYWAHVTPVGALAGAVLGAGVLYALRAAFFRLRGLEALGFGDVKLMAAAGFWVGAWKVPLVLALGALTTLLVIAGLHFAGRFQGEAVGLRDRPFPFGPGLCFALVAVMARMIFDTRIVL